MHHVASAVIIGQRQAGVLSRRQLRADGVGRKAERRLVAAGILVPEGAGVLRLAGTPAGWEQRCWSAVLAAKPGAVLSHRSAATLHGIGRFPRTDVDVVEPTYRSSAPAKEAIHRSTSVPDHHRTEVRGLPVTTVERTVFDLASQVSLKRYRRGLPSLRLGQVARALDDAIGGGIAVQRFQAVHDELAGRGRGGTVVLRGLLEERGVGYVGTESELEDLLVEVLDRFGLPRPARQRNVGGLEDRIGRVDFLYVERRLVIEADGRRNHTALLDREGDAWRDLELAAAGFTVIRVTWRQLQDEPQRFVRALRRVLDMEPTITPPAHP